MHYYTQLMLQKETKNNQKYHRLYPQIRDILFLVFYSNF